MAKIKLDIETNFDALRQAGSNLHSLNNEAEDLTVKMNKAFKTSTNSAEKFDNTVKEGVRDLNKLEKEAAGVEKVGKSFNSANKQAESFGSSLKTMATGFVAGTLITGAMSKISGAFADALEVQKQFEASIQNLSAITGASGKDLDFYKQKAIEMGVSVKGGATAAVEAFKLIGSAKPELLESKEALVAVTESAILLSKASGLELPDAATQLTNALNSFNAPASEAGKFINVLSAASKLGAKEIPFVADALTKFGGVAKSAGVSIETSAAAIEILGAKIPEASSVGTNLRGIFIKLQVEAAKSGREFKGLAGELELLSPKVKDVTFLKEKFGEENLLAIQTLIKEKDALVELTTGITGTNAALEQATINTDTLEQKTLEASNAWDNFTLSLSSGNVGGLMKTIVEGWTESLNGLASVLNGTKSAQDNSLGVMASYNLEFAKSNALTEEQSKKLVEYGVTLDSVTGRLKESSAETIGYFRATNSLNFDFITKTEESKRAFTKSARTDAAIFAAQFKAGVLSAEDFSVKIKIVNDNIKRANEVKINPVDPNAESALKGLTDAEKKALKELADAEKKALEKRKKLFEDFQKALLDLQKKVNAAILEQADPVQKIELQRKGSQDELDLYKEKFIEIGKLNDANFKLSLEQQKQFEFLRNAINIKAAEEQIKLAVDTANKVAAAKLGLTKGQGENLNATEANAISTVNLSAKPKDLSEIDFERVKQLEIIAIQKQFADKKLALKLKEIADSREVDVKAANGELTILGEKQDEESVRKRKNILDSLAIQEEKYALEGDAAQMATAKIINDLQDQQDKLKKDSGVDLASFLGITPDELKKLGDGLAQFGEEIGKLIGQQLDFKLQANQKEIDASKKKQEEIGVEIDDLKSRLENEKDLRDKGLTNNTDRLQAEIDAKTRIQELEKQKELEALENRKKIQKQKLLLDSVLQLSNLATASSNLFASLSPIVVGPVPVGTIIATATIATMLGTFAASKLQALKAINEGNGYEKGGYTGDMGTKEVAGHVHGKEFVSTAKTTKKHRALLEALHADNDGLITKALLSELKGTGIALDKGLPKELSNKRDSLREHEAKVFFKQDNSKIENELIEIKSKLADMMEKQKDKTYKDQNNNLVQKNGSHKTIIRKRGEI